MSFFKEKKVLLMGIFSGLLVLQQIGMLYGRWYRNQNEEIDGSGNDKLAKYEASQLQKVWRQAAVEDLITPENLADQTELKRAHARLKETEIEIQKSEMRVQGVTGNKRKFFEKLHAYYNHSTSALLAIIDFLLAKKGEYSVNGNEINFISEIDGDNFRMLINHLYDIHLEKQELDAFVLQHNKEVEKKLSTR